MGGKVGLDPIAANGYAFLCQFGNVTTPLLDRLPPAFGNLNRPDIMNLQPAMFMVGGCLWGFRVLERLLHYLPEQNLWFAGGIGNRNVVQHRCVMQGLVGILRFIKEKPQAK